MIHALIFNCPCHYRWPQFWRIIVLIDRIFPIVSLLLGAQQKERVYFANRNMKIFRLRCNIGKSCAPISRQNIKRCYSTAVSWEISRQNKQSVYYNVQNNETFYFQIQFINVVCTHEIKEHIKGKSKSSRIMLCQKN